VTGGAILLASAAGGSPVSTPPPAIHVGAKDLPFVEIGGGSKLKVIHVRKGEGLWIIENVFQAGYEVQTHKHTGPVWGYTTSGAWKYKEYDYVNRAGSFLYEPAGSIHTLQCIEDDTRVWFQMYGVNLNLDANGKVDSVADGPGALEFYLAACAAQGLPRPKVLIED
jgi:2,4'-dihydroxyacetophenone dioxygenase